MGTGSSKNSDVVAFELEREEPKEPTEKESDFNGNKKKREEVPRKTRNPLGVSGEEG